MVHVDCPTKLCIRVHAADQCFHVCAAAGEQQGSIRPWRLGTMPAFYEVAAVDLQLARAGTSFLLEFNQPHFSKPADRTLSSLSQVCWHKSLA